MRSALRRPRLPGPASVSGRAPLSRRGPEPTARRGTGVAPGFAPPPQQGRASRARTRAPRRAQLRSTNAFAPPLPLLSPSLSPGGRPQVRAGLAHSAAVDYVYVQTIISVSPEFPPWHGCPRLVFQIPVLNCTCLPDYLWESVGGAEWVENVASFCKRKKTLSPSWRPLPRVTRRETRTTTLRGFHLASDESLGGRGHELSAHADRHPFRAAGGGPGPSYLLSSPSPRKSPRGVFRGRDSNNERAARARRQGLG